MAYADNWTDKQLNELEGRIRSLYGDAVRDMDRTIDQFWNGKIYTNEAGDTVRGASLADKDSYFRQLVQSGDKTDAEYRQWRLNQLSRGARAEELRNRLAERITEANSTAITYINDTTPSIYSLNRNYEAYRIEQSVGAADWVMFDESTVRRLLVQNPQVMPYYPPERALRRGIDLEYGQRQIQKSITSGIMSGYSIGDIADKLCERIVNMGYASAVRAARTAVTEAQNAGRMDSYHAAEEMGIKMKKRWLATLDNRTRHAHAALDGQTIGVDEEFEIDGERLRYPGDSSGSPAMVYNCRCTLISVIDGHEYQGNRIAKDPKTGEYEEIANMTYAQWYEMKTGTPLNPNAAPAEPVHTEQKKFEVFMNTDISDKLGEDFARAMDDILTASGNESVANGYAKYKDELKVVRTDWKGTAHFSYWEGGISIDKATAIAGKIYDAPYQVAFHELGHNLDWLANGKNNFEYYSVAYKNGKLYETLKSDFESLIINAYNNKNGTEYDDLKTLKKGSKLKIGELRSMAVRYVGDIARNEFGKENMLVAGNLSDALEALSGESGGCVGIGHTAAYWKKRGVEFALPKEFFAECCDSAAANRRAYEFTKRFLPNAVNVFEEMMGVL